MDNVEIVELDTKPVVKNKIPWGTIIVFIVLILLIGGYFIYDIFFYKEKVEVSFSFKNDSITMGLNSAYDLKDTIDFTNLGIESITFVLSDNQIVSLENNALISNTKVGEVTLTATYKDIVRTMNVIVSDGTEKNNIVFKSSDNSLAYVDNGSIITRDKSGECTLKATIGDLDTEVKVVVK